MKNEQMINVCRQICMLADDLRDCWLQQCSPETRREIMMLTISQQRMLRTVWRMTETNPKGIMLKELAERLSLSCSAVSVMVEAMVKRGVFERITDENDRRKVFIRVSEAGIRHANTADQGFAELSAGFFAGMDADQTADFAAFIEKFHQYIISSSKKENQK